LSSTFAIEQEYDRSMAASITSALTFLGLSAHALSALVTEDAATTAIVLCLLAGVWFVGTGRQTL